MFSQPIVHWLGFIVKQCPATLEIVIGFAFGPVKCTERGFDPVECDLDW